VRPDPALNADALTAALRARLGSQVS